VIQIATPVKMGEPASPLQPVAFYAHAQKDLKAQIVPWQFVETISALSASNVSTTSAFPTIRSHVIMVHSKSMSIACMESATALSFAQKASLIALHVTITTQHPHVENALMAFLFLTRLRSETIVMIIFRLRSLTNVTRTEYAVAWKHHVVE
jgi:hypothetical protein